MTKVGLFGALFAVLVVFHVSGVYAACTEGGANSNNLNGHYNCTDWDEVYITNGGGASLMYYDCTECVNGTAPYLEEVDQASDYCGETISAYQCYECYVASDCGTDGWESTGNGTEKYQEWSCGGHYCHWAYTDTRCLAGYYLSGNGCEACGTIHGYQSTSPAGSTDESDCCISGGSGSDAKGDFTFGSCCFD